MSVDLDPQEVLQHLYSLGYYNITKEQLKDFIKDLKKLIKYDLRKQERLYHVPQENSLKQGKENVCKNLFEKYIGGSKHPGSNLICGHGEKSSHSHHSCSIPSRIPENYSKQASFIKEPVQLKSSHSSVPCTHHSHICPKCHYTLDCNQPCSSEICAPQCDKEDTDAGSTSEESTQISGTSVIKGSPSKKKRQQPNLKPCPSFIRPRSAKLKPPPKADPVALYHYYKTLWSQCPLPGEKSHEDLRWRIRHKMSAPPVLTKPQSEEKMSKKPEWVPS